MPCVSKCIQEMAEVATKNPRLLRATVFEGKIGVIQIAGPPTQKINVT